MSMDLWSYGKILCLSFEQWRCISILQEAGNVGRRGVCLNVVTRLDDDGLGTAVWMLNSAQDGMVQLERDAGEGSSGGVGGGGGSRIAGWRQRRWRKWRRLLRRRRRRRWRRRRRRGRRRGRRFAGRQRFGRRRASARVEEAEELGDVSAGAAVGITCVADVDGAAEADVDDSGPYGAQAGEEDCSRSNRQEEPVVEPDLPPRRSMRACLRRARLKLVRGNGRTPIDWDLGAMSMDLSS